MTTQPEALDFDKLDAMHERGTINRGHIDKMLAELRRLHSVNQELLHWMRYIQAQTHIGHIHDTASAAIAKAEGRA